MNNIIILSDIQNIYKTNPIIHNMTEEKGVAYIFGILSIVLAFFQPFPGVVIGIIGLVQNRKEKSRTAKMLNILGIIIGVAMIIIVMILSKYLASRLPAGTFPTY